jgi:hypothetical protein
MLFISTYYPAEIAWVDESTPTKGIDEGWGEGRFSIEHHSMRCITTFNGEFYALAVNNFEFGTLVRTNNVQLEQGASNVNMETLFLFPTTRKTLICGAPIWASVAHQWCATHIKPLVFITSGTPQHAPRLCVLSVAHLRGVRHT